MNLSPMYQTPNQEIEHFHYYDSNILLIFFPAIPVRSQDKCKILLLSILPLKITAKLQHYLKH